MRKASLAIVFSVLFAACGQQPADGVNHREDVAAAATAPQTAPPAPASARFDGCVFSAAEVSAALGAPYAAGKDDTDPRSAAALHSCSYEGPDHAALVVHVGLLGDNAATIATSKRMMLQTLAGKLTPVADDADGAIFQEQPELGTYALHYGRARFLYEVRLMAFSGAAASAREKLLRLRRL